MFCFAAGRLLQIIVIILYDVLHNDGDAPVSRVERGVWFPETLVGEAANLSDLIGVDSIGLHDAACGIGGVGGEFSIAVGGRWGVRLRIGVPLNGQLVGKAAELLSKCSEQFRAIGIELGTAANEKSAAGGFREFDAQTLGRYRHIDMALELLEVRHLLHGGLQLFFQLGHVVAGENKVFARTLHVGADFLGSSGGIFEISSDRFLNLFAAVE